MARLMATEQQLLITLTRERGIVSVACRVRPVVQRRGSPGMQVGRQAACLDIRLARLHRSARTARCSIERDQLDDGIPRGSLSVCTFGGEQTSRVVPFRCLSAGVLTTQKALIRSLQDSRGCCGKRLIRCLLYGRRNCRHFCGGVVERSAVC